MISFHTERHNPRLLSSGWRRAHLPHDLPRVSRGITGYAWSPIFWAGGNRSEANFEASYYAAYDFEDPEFSLDEALNAFCDTVAIIGTTKSHRKVKGENGPCDRFRVVVPWERPITDLRTYRYNMAALMTRYPMDKACKDGARFFWPCTKIVHIATDGYCQSVLVAPGSWDPVGLAVGLAVARGPVPGWAEKMLARVVPVGSRSTTFYGIAADLTLSGIGVNQILELILASPTYRDGEVSRETMKDLREAIKSGARKAERLRTTNGSKDGK